MTIYIGRGKTSRTGDLNHLEENRHLNPTAFKRQLDNVFRQSGNDYLEKVRGALIEAHKRRDFREVERLERILLTIR